MTENIQEVENKQLTLPENKEFGMILMGGGALGSLFLVFNKNKSIFSWLLPLGMIVAGIELYLKDRKEHIEQTGDEIMAKLDELDPIARAEVVKYLADQEKDRLSR